MDATLRAPLRIAPPTTPPSRQKLESDYNKMPITFNLTPPPSPPYNIAQNHPSDVWNRSSRSDEDSLYVPRTKEYMESLIPPSQDGFERIAQEQAKREEERKRQRLEERRKSLETTAQAADSKQERDDAARMIQKTFRGYRARREMQGFSLDASTRWVTAIREAQFREMNRPRARSTIGSANGASSVENGGSETTAREKWKKASVIARRAGHDDLESSSESSLGDINENATPEEKAAARAASDKANAKRRHEAQMMGLQYFLEMVDLKHRYGSNLRMYHEEWKKSNTNENFFYWLDYGEGRNIELDVCPRDRLEREQVRYLSREERQYYLVKVDSEGRLCWAKNGERIDTTEKYKDSVHGIVPFDDSTPAFNPMAEPEPRMGSRSGSSLSSIESAREADRAAKYATPGFDESQGFKKVSHLSASTIFNKLLRKSVKKNTWIFVADTSFRLYVGIKNSGAFQHSSFLSGSRISAAGLIKVKDGRLSSLSPLSGHYRPPAANFRAFTKSIKASGVDMSHVSISKSYAVLVGLEVYIGAREKGKDLLERMSHRKERMIDPEEAARRDEQKKDNSKSAERERQVLEEERQRRGSTGARLMQRLRFGSTSEGVEKMEGERV